MSKYGRMTQEERTTSGMLPGVCVDFKSKETRFRAYLSLPKRGKALLYYGPDLETANRIALEAQRLRWYPKEYIDTRKMKLLSDLAKLQAIEKEYERINELMAADAVEVHY